ncbi:response regulator [Synechocystis salina LEGE 06099]|uniref:response regulator n=1 Tax=Synechocystis salina TaxID=945780 RepID=UPI00187EB539|nr:response regulator [Synechocystis salina]MBE9202621.1 response regulator [Synechocystis salina LEGE 06099]
MFQAKILVVHHDDRLRFIISQSLDSTIYEVSQAMDLPTALRILNQKHFDMVILDSLFAKIDRVDVIQWLMHDYPYLRIVVATVNPSVEEALAAMRSGAVDFLQPSHSHSPIPFNSEQIQLVVSQALDRPHPWHGYGADYETLLSAARNYLELHNYGQAISFTKEALRCDPCRPEALTLLGQIEESQGDRLNALKKYRAAIDLDPTYRPAHENLDRSTTDRGRPVRFLKIHSAPSL